MTIWGPWAGKKATEELMFELNLKGLVGGCQARGMCSVLRSSVSIGALIRQVIGIRSDRPYVPG